jgi:hypothetical protein
MNKCSICGKVIIGFGNNPYPLCHIEDYKSRCCNDCDKIVLSARMLMAFKKMNREQVQMKFLGKVCEK